MLKYRDWKDKMNGYQYQVAAERTMIDKVPDAITTNQDTQKIIWCTVGVAGEAGELVDCIKKGVLHQHGLDIGLVQDEIGDLMWYIANLCNIIGLDLSDIMEFNLSKLRRRYPNGYNPEDSRNRIDK